MGTNDNLNDVFDSIFEESEEGQAQMAKESVKPGATRKSKKVESTVEPPSEQPPAKKRAPLMPVNRTPDIVPVELEGNPDNVADIFAPQPPVAQTLRAIVPLETDLPIMVNGNAKPPARRAGATAKPSTNGPVAGTAPNYARPAVVQQFSGQISAEPTALAFPAMGQTATIRTANGKTATVQTIDVRAVPVAKPKPLPIEQTEYAPLDPLDFFLLKFREKFVFDENNNQPQRVYIPGVDSTFVIEMEINKSAVYVHKPGATKAGVCSFIELYKKLFGPAAAANFDAELLVYNDRLAKDYENAVLFSDEPEDLVVIANNSVQAFDNVNDYETNNNNSDQQTERNSWVDQLEDTKQPETSGEVNQNEFGEDDMETSQDGTKGRPGRPVGAKDSFKRTRHDKPGRPAKITAEDVIDWIKEQQGETSERQFFLDNKENEESGFTPAEKAVAKAAIELLRAIQQGVLEKVLSRD